MTSHLQTPLDGVVANPSTNPSLGSSGESSVPARLVTWGRHVTVHWREDASLACDAVGRPKPALSWTKDGQMLDRTEQRCEMASIPIDQNRRCSTDHIYTHIYHQSRGLLWLSINELTKY